MSPAGRANKGLFSAQHPLRLPLVMQSLFLSWDGSSPAKWGSASLAQSPFYRIATTLGRGGLCPEIVRAKDHVNLELPEVVGPHVGTVCLRMRSAGRKAGLRLWEDKVGTVRRTERV